MHRREGVLNYLEGLHTVEKVSETEEEHRVRLEEVGVSAPLWSGDVSEKILCGDNGLVFHEGVRAGVMDSVDCTSYRKIA